MSFLRLNPHSYSHSTSHSTSAAQQPNSFESEPDSPPELELDSPEAEISRMANEILIRNSARNRVRRPSGDYTPYNVIQGALRRPSGEYTSYNLIQNANPVAPGVVVHPRWVDNLPEDALNG